MFAKFIFIKLAKTHIPFPFSKATIFSVSEVPLQIATTSFEVFQSNPMTVFDQSSFARAVQKREAKKSAQIQSTRTHSKSSTTSVFRRKDKSEKENILSTKKDKSGKENCSEMTMKKKLLGKLFKILTLKESSTKKCSKEDKKSCHTRRRSRSSHSSNQSNFEPMPTIYEENEESDLISLHSFAIHKQQTYQCIAVAC
uniref:Uncharacterized protein n=1 Tax=Panagrolaimus sp. ES5 TaxID=591445 RepID=A0AC34FR85_9BILA